VAEVAHSHASADDPLGVRCWPPVEDSVVRNSLQVVAARASGQVNCPSRSEWARYSSRAGHWRPSTGCYHGRWRLPCLFPRCSPPASKIRDRLADARYIAEPKLDGQRAQLHVLGYRTVHVFSRLGRELIGLPGLVWLRDVRWPIASAVIDGEAVAGDGSEGIQAVFEARNRPGSPMAFTAFDLLELDGQSVMGEAWTVRRKRLEDLLEPPPPGICLVLVTDGAPALWDAWIGMGGEGIVLKERLSLYRSGVRSPEWLKLKPKLSLDAVVTGGSPERIRWSDWGEAVMLELRYTHPRTGADVEIRQAVRVPRDLPFDLRLGERVGLVCWGVMPSGMLRHPVLRAKT
jgi:hypothetical protein